MKRYCIFFNELEISKQLRKYLNDELFEGMSEYRGKSYCNIATLLLEVNTLDRMKEDAGSAINVKKIVEIRIELKKLCMDLKKQKIQIVLL